MSKTFVKPESIHPDTKAEMRDVMPKVQIDYIPPHRRKQLLDITRFTGLETEDWFEEWLAVWLNFEFEDIEQGRETAWYYRKLFKMKQNMENWRRFELSSLEVKLHEEANNPHDEYSYLYQLELCKLKCMREELTDRGGLDDSDKYWIGVAIKLLEMLVGEHQRIHGISKKRVKAMNIRNLKELVDKEGIDRYLNEKDGSMKYHYGRRLYVKKIERLYYKIRLYHTQSWWI